jgi:hypothetical protein
MKITIDRLSALKVQDGAQRVGLETVLHFADGARNADLTCGLGFDAEEERRHSQRRLQGIGVWQRIGQCAVIR